MLAKGEYTDVILCSGPKILRDFPENHAVWVGVEISIRLLFLSTGPLASICAVTVANLCYAFRIQTHLYCGIQWGHIAVCVNCQSIADGSEYDVRLDASDWI